MSDQIDSAPKLHTVPGESQVDVAVKAVIKYVGLGAAVRSAIGDIQISLQNVLAFAATFAIPFFLNVLGTTWVIALAVGLSLVAWFLAWRVLPFITRKMNAIWAALTMTVFLIGGSFLVSAPPQSSLPHEIKPIDRSVRQETTGAQSPAVVSDGDVKIRYGTDKGKSKNQ